MIRLLMEDDFEALHLFLKATKGINLSNLELNPTVIRQELYCSNREFIGAITEGVLRSLIILSKRFDRTCSYYLDFYFFENQSFEKDIFTFLKNKPNLIHDYSKIRAITPYDSSISDPLKRNGMIREYLDYVFNREFLVLDFEGKEK